MSETINDALLRRRILRELRFRSSRAHNEFAAAAWAGVFERPLRAIRTIRALKAANASVGRVKWQIAITERAIGAKFEHDDLNLLSAS